MKSDKMQQARYELKYLLVESQAVRMREFIKSYLDLDEFGHGQPNYSYPTLSLYLDSDGLATYGHTINGNKNRFKLRLRYYDERPHTPVFFEVKRRMNDVILKQRAAVRKDAVRVLLTGQMPDRDHLLNPDMPEQYAALQHFIELMVQLEARPKMHIAYLREAYENEDNNAVRVTFDRAVESAPQPAVQLAAKHHAARRVFDPHLVLELKFTDRFPQWFRELVETFNCMQCGAAKFAQGIDNQGEAWVHRGCAPKPAEVVLDEFLAGAGFPH